MHQSIYGHFCCTSINRQFVLFHLVSIIKRIRYHQSMTAATVACITCQSSSTLRKIADKREDNKTRGMLVGVGVGCWVFGFLAAAAAAAHPNQLQVCRRQPLSSTLPLCIVHSLIPPVAPTPPPLSLHCLYTILHSCASFLNYRSAFIVQQLSRLAGFLISKRMASANVVIVQRLPPSAPQLLFSF